MLSAKRHKYSFVLGTQMEKKGIYPFILILLEKIEVVSTSNKVKSLLNLRKEIVVTVRGEAI